MSNVYVHFSQISFPARYSVVNLRLESHSLRFREVINICLIDLIFRFLWFTIHCVYLSFFRIFTNWLVSNNLNLPEVYFLVNPCHLFILYRKLWITIIFFKHKTQFVGLYWEKLYHIQLRKAICTLPPLSAASF